MISADCIRGEKRGRMINRRENLPRGAREQGVVVEGKNVKRACTWAANQKRKLVVRAIIHYLPASCTEHVLPVPDNAIYFGDYPSRASLALFHSYKLQDDLQFETPCLLFRPSILDFFAPWSTSQPHMEHFSWAEWSLLVSLE